jgi:glyoxylase-like metal-dependent hydrolase (beta-lactamase superfamily II)
MLKIQTFVNGPIQENAYLLYEEGAKEAVLIDPGDEAGRLEKEIRALGVTVKLILATHGHFDHVGAVAALAKAFGATFGMQLADDFLLESLEDTAAFYGQQATKRPQVDLVLRGGESVGLPGLQLKVLATPGHTPGGLCYYHAESGSLFSGDTLFEGTIGRSDTEGGNHQQLIDSIHRELLPLPDDTRVYPGHGDNTSIGAERHRNPHLQGKRP